METLVEVSSVCAASAAGKRVLLFGKSLHFKFRITLTEVLLSVYPNQIIFSNRVAKRILSTVRTLTIITLAKKE